jgi:hypothetical protein
MSTDVGDLEVSASERFVTAAVLGVDAIGCRPWSEGFLAVHVVGPVHVGRAPHTIRIEERFLCRTHHTASRLAGLPTDYDRYAITRRGDVRPHVRDRGPALLGTLGFTGLPAKGSTLVR